MEEFYLEGGVDHAGGCLSQCLSRLGVLGARDGRGVWLKVLVAGFISASKRQFAFCFCETGFPGG